MKLCSETLNQIAVDFHQVQLHACLGQRGGQCGLTRADLDQQLADLWRNGVDDFPDDHRVCQEILSEPFSSPHFAPLPPGHCLRTPGGL